MNDPHPTVAKSCSRQCRREFTQRIQSDTILQLIREGERFLVCSHSRP
jgi:hypothetical protein